VEKVGISEKSKKKVRKKVFSLVADGTPQNVIHIP